jgi:regulator of protease activity HflC (stomatin/prohibitin superfamily)
MSPNPGPDWKAASQRVFGTRRGRLGYLLLAGGLAALFVYSTFAVYVGPNERAIKQITVGPDRGIKPEVITTGLHYVGPSERLHKFPTDLQVLNLTNDPNERTSDDDLKAPALNLTTAAGYNVTVDASVLYRIEDPYKVMLSIGPGTGFETKLVIPRAEQILRKRFGELDAEDFYDVKKRTEKDRLALEDLNAELVPNGVRAIGVYVRRYTYDKAYQEAIEQRKIQDQTVFKNMAEAEMAQADAERKRIEAEGEAAVRVELARGDAEKQKLDAEAELYQRTQAAEGEKEIKLAEAEGTRLKALAYQGTGSEFQVGLKMADALKGTKAIVIPTDGEGGMNPLDLNTALKRFDVTP